MTQTAIPIQLATRIADVTSKEHQRHAIFTITANSLDPQKVFNALRTDIKKLGDDASYKLAWFRCDNFITVLMSGTPAATAYVFAFIAKGNQRKLFQSGEVVYEGAGTHKFRAETDELLQQYAAPTVKHSFGGTN
jgi:hypothetical protein